LPAAINPSVPEQATAAPPKQLPAAEPRTVARNELPPDVQRALPPLTMSGSVYSPDARNRMVIVDGRLMMEGEPVAQGLVVERINPKSVVMRYQNHRFNVPL
jgi:general secretion pathway protein B